jgi:hypothetical protein
MKKIILVLAISTLSIFASHGSNLALSMSLIKAIASKNVAETERLLVRAKEPGALTQQQKEAILESARKQVRCNKAKIKTFFDTSVDACRLARGVVLSLLGVGKLYFGRKLEAQEKGAKGKPIKNIKPYVWGSRFLIGSGVACVGAGLYNISQAFGLDDLGNAKKIKQLIKKELFGIEPKPEAAK